jgi:branched-chain amino acid transport system permease protein
VADRDIATVCRRHGRRRFHIKRSMYWPLGLLAAAVVYFIYSYLDSTSGLDHSAGVHDFMNTYLPLLNVNEAIVYVMAALGLNVVVGYAGLLDLGFVAFWAIGGYTAGWLASDFFYGRRSGSLAPRFSEGTARHPHQLVDRADRRLRLCALGGIIIGAPTLRLRSDYLALVTLGFGEIIAEVASTATTSSAPTSPTATRSISPVDYVAFPASTIPAAGHQGSVPSDGLPKFVLFCLSPRSSCSPRCDQGGPLGRAWLAIREDELAASLMGVPLMRTKLSAYAFGAVAGGSPVSRSRSTSAASSRTS